MTVERLWYATWLPEPFLRSVNIELRRRGLPELTPDRTRRGAYLRNAIGRVERGQRVAVLEVVEQHWLEYWRA